MSLTKNQLHLWFMYLFEQQMDADGYVRCFECGGKMHESVYKTLSTCYSHLLSKVTYDHLKGDIRNVKIVHPDCHNLYTMKPQLALKQYAAMLKLLNTITDEYQE